ncbi:MAG: hypothetical protein AAF297_00945 [Planctomycetota bacterium]
MADAFDVLGLGARFDVPPAAVERAYLAAAARAHPDAAGGSDDAAASMARLNEARGVLRDGERRARALLARHGLVVAEDRSLPDGFLESMLETRMEIESAIAGGDESERQRWTEWAEERRGAHTEAIQALFAKLDQPGAPIDDIGAHIRIELNAWRYIERLIEQLDPGYDPARADFS